MENDDILYICVSCKKDGAASDPRPGRILYNNIKNHNPDINIKPVRCLAGCKKGCTLSLRHKDKWSYIIGNLTPDLDEQDIIYGFEEYKKTTDGKIPFSRRPNAFKSQSLARIPPLNYELNEDE